MSSENKTGDQTTFNETESKGGSEEKNNSLDMGVASPSTKRRLEVPDGDPDIIASKLAKITKNNNHNNNEYPTIPSNTPTEDSTTVTTDFLTTSILARTLLTTSTVNGSQELTPDPLESLKSTLDALPPPSGSLLSPFLKPTISGGVGVNDAFSSLLCHEPSLTPVVVVNGISPMQATNGAEWNSDDHQVITEEENGKSYFNLGSADATIVARKSSSHWTNGNSSLDIDDNASSSSCESLSSSEDLFNSGEDEFDPSDDEDEEEFSSYKQQRSTVLHLSLCKLNKFRSHCVEPSLHRSVLICNTLRHIEQEIKSEDEVDESLKSRERLPSFWRPTTNHHPHCFGSSPPPTNQPLITDARPIPLIPLPSDPYLSPNPYSSSNNPLTQARESIQNVSISGSGATSPTPYLYDYTCLRPTPYHTTSYEYEQDLPSLETTGNSSTILECDSGYGEELSYYYSTPGSGTPSTPTTPTTPTPTPTPTIPTSTTPSDSSTTQTQTSPTSSSSSFIPFSPTPPNPTDRLDNNSNKSDPETDSDTSSGGSSPPQGESSNSNSNNNWKEGTVPALSLTQQDSQCGMESRRFNTSSQSISMPMDNLISSSYSSSL